MIISLNENVLDVFSSLKYIININLISFFLLFKMRLPENFKLPLWLTCLYWTVQMDSGEVGVEKQSAEDQAKTGNYSKVLQEMVKFRSKAVTLGTDGKGQVKRFFK